MGRKSFFFQAEDGIRDSLASRGLGYVYKGQVSITVFYASRSMASTSRPSVDQVGLRDSSTLRSTSIPLETAVSWSLTGSGAASRGFAASVP